MKRVKYFILLGCLVFIAAPAAKRSPSDHDFGKTWSRIDSLESQGLYRSALTLAEQVFNGAREVADSVNEIKALIYRLKYTKELEEEGDLKALELMASQLEDVRPVPVALKSTLMAELLQRYFEVNRWEIFQRPDQKNEPALGSTIELENWGPANFYTAILFYYRKSVESGAMLSKIPVTTIQGLCTGSLADTVNTKTIFDLLVKRALGFLDTADDSGVAFLKPAILCDSQLFQYSGPGMTGGDDLHPEEANNPWIQSLQWYSFWLNSSPGNLSARLQWLAYLQRESCHSDADSLYQNALENLAARYGNQSGAPEIFEALAVFHLDRGSRYQINGEDTTLYRLDRERARFWLRKGVLFDESRAGKNCQNLLTGLLLPELTAQAESVVIPSQWFPVSLEYRNVAHVYYSLYRIGVMDYQTSWNNLEQEERIARLKSLKPDRTGSFSLPGGLDLNPHRVNLPIEPSGPGFFLLVFSSTGKWFEGEGTTCTVSIVSSRIALVSRIKEAGARDFYFRDRRTGGPLEGLRVEPVYNRYDPAERRSVIIRGRSFTTGEEGNLTLMDSKGPEGTQSSEAYRVLAVLGADTLLTQESFYPGYGLSSNRKQTIARVYTDRSLYRPAQTLFFRGVLIDQEDDILTIHQRDSITVNLQDPRYQIVGKLTLPVDDFGVFTGSLTLPGKGLTGNYFLQTPYGTATFSVEAYKLPTFDITLEPGDQPYNNGDIIRIGGLVKALSGEPIPLAGISVDVDLSPYRGLRRWVPYPVRKTRVYHDEIKTNESGEFGWSWKTIEELTNPFGQGTPLQYEITFRVTDLSGETREEKCLISCGKGTGQIILTTPERIFSGDTLSLEAIAMGIDGRKLRVPVELVIEALESPEQPYISPVLPDADRFIVTRKEWTRKFKGLPYKKEHLPSEFPVFGQVHIANGNSVTNPGFRMPTNEWKEGWYKVTARSGVGLLDSVCRFIRIDEMNADRIREDEGWVVRLNRQSAQPGDWLSLTTGSRARGYILTELQLPGNILTDWWSPSGKTLSTAGWKVGQDWAGGAVVQCLMIQNNRIYKDRYRIDIPVKGRKLKILGLNSLEKVSPGDSVKLELKVVDDQDQPVNASIGITVFDASLDLIRRHTWEPVVWPVYHGITGYEALPIGMASSWQLTNYPAKWVDIPFIEPLAINWWGMGYFGMGGRLQEPMMMKTAVAESPNALGRSAGKAATDQAADADPLLNARDSMPESAIGSVVVRKDFRDLALFSGIIQTDSAGLATVAFKMPEKFTEWRILAAGHSEKMAFGMAEHRFRSSKDLMLKPNLPFFMRLGDSLQVSARVGWQGKGLLNPLVNLRIENEKGSLDGNFKSVKLSMNPGEQKGAVWSYKPASEGLLRLKMTAVDGVEADGLEDTLRVLSDRALLWNSRPFFFNKPDKRILTVTGENRQAILEMTTTPAWQVLLSLPVITDQERDCSEYWFSRLYLASVTGLIAERLPDAKRFFTQNSVNEILDSISHPLLRNSSIRGKNWSETPWSQIVENEQKRVKQIQRWMDNQERANELVYLLEKIAALQNADGTWPWFRGMGTDWFTTQQIVAGFGELKGWQVFDITTTQRGNNLMSRALEALDGYAGRQFREMMKRDSAGIRKVQLDPMIIHYLYARSFFTGWTISAKDELAWLHYMERIGVEWIHHDPGLQSLMAIAAVQSGRTSLALPIFRSLKERMLESEEMGSWWPRKGKGSAFYHWDLWMQSRMIELFASFDEGRKDLDKLRLYLLRQKQGRDWGNGLVAAWAAKSLLFFGSDLMTKPADINVKWGKETFSTLRIQTGSTGPAGYYRYSWDTPESIPVSKSLEITHSGGGPAWGTLYTLENHTLNELSATGSNIRLKREISVQEENGAWKPIEPGRVVKPGTVLKISLRVESDRQLDYVEIRDILGTGFVPVRALSGYRFSRGIGYYQGREPEAMVFYLPVLTKGIQVLEYEAVAEQQGDYFAGYSTLQCLYAPEFRGWSNSARIHVSDR